ncbi:hypothetical protein PYK79_23850 [Streptomyces sp. ID05-04B]|uniref:hypothetical protein n=1 Tax=Streptomyces sp. ID05-04B TaxID=3028661 RepID=UPI000D1B0625|nr:hypothetical protein [Streptomyces sp. ID05-04B]AVV44148.1 hypothetical protein C6376_24600 [Streptomyces sp. P3]MDX5565739.1 hypothetical protein [Streptomyces sp. ID05-04B]
MRAIGHAHSGRRPWPCSRRAVGGPTVRFSARARIDTPTEADDYRHVGILPCAPRTLLPT